MPKRAQGTATMRFACPLILVASLGNLVNVHAFSSGAGACGPGNTSVQGPHLVAAKTGSLSDGGFTVSLDGKDLAEGETGTLPVGKDVKVTLSGASFKGFLLRLGKTDVDTKGAFTAEGNDVQVAAVCSDAGGITHQSSSAKTTVSGTLNLAEPAADMPLDVTVVVKNMGGESEYYYSNYKLTAGAAPAAEEPKTPEETEPPKETAELSEETEAPELSEETEAPELSEATEAPELSEATEAPELSEATEAPEPSEATEAPEPSEAIEAPEPSEATEAPEPSEATEAPELSEATEAPEPSEATKVPEDTKPGAGVTSAPVTPSADTTTKAPSTTAPPSKETATAPASSPAAAPGGTTAPEKLCEDDLDYTFSADGVGPVGCFWLSKRPSQQTKLCTGEVKTKCHETCGHCNDECEDDKTAKITFQVVGGKTNTNTCEWLRKHIVVWPLNCKAGSEAFDKCKETCNNCAEASM